MKTAARSLLTTMATTVGLLGLASSAQATSTWTFNGTSGGTTASSVTCTGGCTTDGILLDVQGISSNGLSNSSTFSSSTVTAYTGGLGVSTDSTSAPNHALDNQGQLEFILLRFSTPVSLSSLNIGWASYDSDLTVLAYTGDTTTNTDATALSSVTSKTLSTLVASSGSTGWTLVGSYANAGTGDESLSNSTGTVYSSWWIVSAYNSVIGGTTSYSSSSSSSLSNGSGTPGYSGVTYASSGYDYVKLYSVTASTKVPEPGSLALAGLALGGALIARRRAQKKT